MYRTGDGQALCVLKLRNVGVLLSSTVDQLSSQACWQDFQAHPLSVF